MNEETIIVAGTDQIKRIVTNSSCTVSHLISKVVEGIWDRVWTFHELFISTSCLVIAKTSIISQSGDFFLTYTDTLLCCIGHGYSKVNETLSLQQNER